MRERKGLGRALLIEDLPAVSAVMLAVGECEGSSAAQTDVGVYPLGGGLGVDHDRVRGGKVFWRKLEP
jgi:hypothetical protein